MSEKIKVLLTGASGAVGREVLQELVRRNHEFDLTVFDKKSKASRRILQPFIKEIQLVYGNISNSETTREVCKNKDFVIHLAAVIPPKADELPDLAYRVNVLGTKNLIENLKAFSPHAFFIYTSSISVYGDRVKNPAIRIGDPLKPSEGDAYAATKIEAEKLVRESGLHWTIFRLTAIFGPSNLRLDPLFFHMPLDTSLELATTRDTGVALVQAIHHSKKLKNSIFNLGGGETCRISYRDFLQRSFSIFGLGGFNIPEKAFAMQNFHCGIYADGEDLEKILHFRNETVDDLLRQMSNHIPLIQRWVTKLFSKQIKRSLIKKSEPLNALKQNNIPLIKRFYG